MRKTTASLLALLVTLVGFKAMAAAPLTCTDAAGNLFSFTLAAVVPPPVVTPPPVPGVTYGYKDGAFTWGGDFTQNNTSVDYKDTAGDPGHLDIAFTSTQAYGLYLPYFGPSTANFLIPNPGYTSLTLALKPTQAGGKFTVMFVRSNDVPTNCVVNLSPAPVVGQFTVYTLSLKALCVDTDAKLYKFVLQDQSGHSNKWYMKDLGFVQ